MFAMTNQEKFWKWFLRHEDELFHFEKDQERIFDKLASQLQKLEKNLCFEFGPKPKREFVISAGGIQSAFPAVSALVLAAPKLDRWQVIAFRPRRSPINRIEYQGENIDPENVQFSLLDNGNIPGVYLYLPGYQDGSVTWRQIGYLLLDEALGEFDVESHLSLIKMFAADTSNDLLRYPLTELPNLFDQRLIKLGRRSELPS